MNCKHKWIGDTCCECGVHWGVWAESTLTHYESALKEAKVALERIVESTHERVNHNFIETKQGFANHDLATAGDALATINKVLGEK